MVEGLGGAVGSQIGSERGAEPPQRLWSAPGVGQERGGHRGECGAGSVLFGLLGWGDGEEGEGMVPTGSGL